ncbi:preprotein translocase subunit SecA [Candidatus Kaiserbacteria bacterium CG10_big_fil_rev_8_21_14_0_10_49_17]|uniref:Protein translocase subunit SecA n=1 Tax=Candidatus Kaiserbacteria bacterium CG10_big_fil_rev_8_21_14_0_10_49_17 TaxID=1974609 RepID=A0A2M6WEW8_9BACT|nr:MAG: preprotein translocase subunit SecA [Candidatus Kaiserbacteria bacterium CG10_big_fil_rev_8_21_14_0_10_49_17]
MVLKTLFTGDENRKALKRLSPLVEKINEYESAISDLSDEELAEQTVRFKERLEDGEDLDALLPEAYATVREAAKRTLSQRHFDVQLMGGIVLHQRGIAEMRTGEGKTLVATLPTYLNALTGNGVHVVTVNDYLSRRDAVWMGQIYAALGLSVGVINTDNSYLYDKGHVQKDEERDELGSFKVVHDFLRPCERKEAYAADITYGTNNEFGFDYLRDNIEYNPDDLRQRGYAFAIVDEIDSILIDEARTPLIISAPSVESGNLYTTFARIAAQLEPETHYTVEEKHRQIALTDAGIEKAEEILGIDNIYTEKGIKYVHHLETAVRAKALFRNDKEYVVRDGQVIIVDEFTGRLQPGRRWSEGLHQAIEAKEDVPIQKESRTYASVTFQNYFRMYEKLAGMTGTAKTSSEEFYKVYGLEVVEVPTNKEVKRIDHGDLIFQTEKGKFQAIARTVKDLNKKGQPVLIGTASIEKNELLSAYLTKEGVTHEVLNAKNHEREGEIIAQAGRRGNVTIATNMAGRGVDIKLGGNPATEEEYEKVKELGGLFVLGTERHEARRIDNQLRGRSGRQGDPGETQFFVSLEDQLMRVFASETIKKMMGRFGIPEDEPIENSLITKSLETAQSKIEGFNFDARKAVLSYDDILDHQRKAVYEKRRKVLLGSDADVEELLGDVLALDDSVAHVVAKKRTEMGDEAFFRVVRRLVLQTIDTLWVEHLESMDYLRSSVNLRAYGQRDPIVEYRKEGLQMFKEMQASFDSQLLHLLPNIQTGAFRNEEPKELKEVHEGALSLTAQSKNSQPAKKEKIGRNDIVRITDGKEVKEMKFKKAEELLASGEWTLQEDNKKEK